MIVKLEDKVCTRAQALRLKELGVPNDHTEEFCIYSIIDNEQEHIHINVDEDDPAPNYQPVKLYDVAELGELLAKARYESMGFPMMFTSYSHNSDFSAELLGKWSCMVRNPRGFENLDIKADTEVQARAQFLIFLLENKHITLNY